MASSRLSTQLILGALTVLLLSGVAHAQDALLLVTSPRPTTETLDADVVSQQEVTVDDLDALSDPMLSAVVRVDLAKGLSLTVSRIAGLTADVPWLGSVVEIPDSTVVLSVESGVLTGRIYGPFGAFRIRQRNGIYLAQELLITSSDDGEANRFAIIPFLENTEVFWTLQNATSREGKFPYYLEADIVPHLVFTQNFTDILDISKQQQRGLSGLKRFAYSFSGTPGVKLRMLREESAPVRTPSFMPRGNFQLLWVRGLRDCAPDNPDLDIDCPGVTAVTSAPAIAPEASVQRALALLSTVSVWEAHFIFGHHSNGQDGCVSTEQREEPPLSGLCVPSATVVTSATINRRNGTFQTNYMRVGINYSHHWMEPGALMQASREARIKIEFEHHLKSTMEPAIADLYGRERLNVLGSFAARGIPGCRKRIEGSVSGTWNPDVVDPTDKGAVAVQGSCYPTKSGGWGLFARYYIGQDYYNLGFLDNLSRLQFGMTFNQSDFFRFRRSAAP